jgi:hypothetical protein
VIRFSAHALRPKGQEPNDSLNVVLFASGKRVIPKQVRGDREWLDASTILSPLKGKSRDYVWRVSAFQGQQLRVVVIDKDERPGCHLYCTGFRFESSDSFEGREFGKYMVRIAEEHKLPPVARFESKHFVGLSTADDGFTIQRMQNCELMYDLFYDHFIRKGFRLYEPGHKLMVAIFDSQDGFDAYFGQALPSVVAGIYHPETNRLVVYDLGQNSEFLAVKKYLEGQKKRIRSDLHRKVYIETVHRLAREARTGANVGTVMHEVAHQISFNAGMLNRNGDVPIWLAEGLATYCEPTDAGTWKGIGEPNPERLYALAGPARNRGRFIPLEQLLGDGWLHGRKVTVQQALLGYAQSWALFRMLMEEQPSKLRQFMALIYSRRTSDYRLADFLQVFGPDLERIELRHQQYCKRQVEMHLKEE